MALFELDAVAAVDLHAAGVVLPDDAELDHALRLHHALKQRRPLVFGWRLTTGSSEASTSYHGL